MDEARRIDTVYDLGLSRETLEALEQAGLNNLYKLTHTDRDKLIEMLGEERVREIRDCLWAEGMRLCTHILAHRRDIDSHCPASPDGHHLLTCIRRYSDSVLYEMQCRYCEELFIEIT